MDNGKISKYIDEKCSFCDFFDDEEFRHLANLSVDSGKVVTILSTAVNGYKDNERSKKDPDYEYETDIVQISMVHIFDGEIYLSTTNFKPSHEIMERTIRTHGITNLEAETLQPMDEEFSDLINTIFKNHIVISFNFYDFDYKNIKEAKAQKNLLSCAPSEFYDFEKMIKTLEGVEGELYMDSAFRILGTNYNGIVESGDFSTSANVLKMVSLADNFFAKHSIEKVMEVYGTPEEKKERMDMMYSNNFIEEERDALSSEIQSKLSEMSFENFIKSDFVSCSGLGNIAYKVNEMLDCGILDNRNVLVDAGAMSVIKKATGPFFEKSFFDYNKAIGKLKSEKGLSDIGFKDIYLKLLMCEKGLSWPDKKRNSVLKSECSIDGQSDIEFDVSM